jgi:farnesyl diphosphate synthase
MPEDPDGDGQVLPGPGQVALDLFGDPSVTGKVGTDIQGNKGSWLVVQCLLRACPQQRQILEENYGQKDPEKVAR